MLLALVTVALAQSCPWEYGPTVTTKGAKVTIDGTPYWPLRSMDEARAFRSTLRACGAGEAVHYLDTWEQSRLYLPVGLVLSALTVGVIAAGGLESEAGGSAVIMGGTSGAVFTILGPMRVAGVKGQLVEAIEDSGRERAELRDKER